MAGLAVQRGVLISRNARDGYFRPEHGWVRDPEFTCRRAHLWKHGFRNVEERHEIGVPLEIVEIEQHRARRIRSVGGVDGARGEAMKQPCVDSAEAQLAVFRHALTVWEPVEEPSDLGRRKVWVEYQTGRLPDVALVSRVGQLAARFGSAAALPHDGVRHGSAGLTIPNDGRLPLIRNADAGDAGEVEPCSLDRGTGRGDRRVGDLLRVVFHPTRFGIALFEIDLRRRYRLSVTVEDDGARAGSSLVQGQDVCGGCQ